MAKSTGICASFSRPLHSQGASLTYDNNTHYYICSPSTKCVAVLEDRSVKWLVTYPTPVLDVCVNTCVQPTTTPPRLEWWTLTDDGVWKSSTPDGDHSKTRNGFDSMDIDPDIFTELLQVGDTTQTYGTAGNGNDSNYSSCGQKILLGTAGAKKILIFGNSLILLIQNGLDSLVAFHNIQKSGSRTQAQFQRNIHVKQSIPSPIENPERLQISAALYVVLPVDTKLKDSYTNMRTILLHHSLFTYLFGSEISLVGTPICLMTSQLGIIYSMPLVPQDRSSVPNITMDIGEPIIALFSLTVALKLGHGESKLSIQNCAPNSSTLDAEKSGNCFLILGRNGKVHILLSIKSNRGKNLDAPANIISQICMVPGPVTCGDILGNLLLHGTDREVYVTDLTMVLRGLMDDADHLEQFAPLTSHPQSVCNIIQLTAEVPRNAGKEAVTAVTYMALSSKGRLMHLRATCDQTPPPRLLSHSPGGSRIKDVLTGISRVSDLMENVNKRLKRQDETLEQLHIASLLSTATCPPRKLIQKTGESLHNVVMSGPDCPLELSWCLSTREEQSGSCTWSFVLRVVPVTISLSKGWSLSVSVTQASSSLESASKHSTVQSKVVDIGDLSARQFKDVTFDMDDLMSGIDVLPLTIYTNLMYQIPVGTSDQGNNTKDEKLPPNPICLPMPNIILDIFHFLRPVSESCVPGSPELRDPDRVLDTLARARCCYDTHNAKRGQTEVKGHGICSSSFPVSSAQTKHLKVKSASELLQWLFRENNIKTSGTVIRVSSPSNHQGSITILSPSANKYQVNIQSQQMALLCQMESSLRKQFMVTKSEERDTVTTLQIRKALGQVQNLLQDVEQIQEQQNHVTSHSLVPQILAIHQKLKDVQI